MSDESINQSSVKKDTGLYLEFQIQNGLDKVSKIWKTKLLREKKNPSAGYTQPPVIRRCCAVF